MGCSLEKAIENLIQVELDKHEVMSENWFSIVEIGALKRDIKVAVKDVAQKIQKKRDFLKLHQLETNLAESFDWNIGYNHGLNKAIDFLNEVLDLLVEEGEK